MTDLAVVLAGDWPGQAAVPRPRLSPQVPVDGRCPENIKHGNKMFINK